MDRKNTNVTLRLSATQTPGMRRFTAADGCRLQTVEQERIHSNQSIDKLSLFSLAIVT